jgi:hypothetical protein
MTPDTMAAGYWPVVLGVAIFVGLKAAGYSFRSIDAALARRTGRSLKERLWLPWIAISCVGLTAVGIWAGITFGFVAGLTAPLYVIGGIALIWAFVVPRRR